MTKVTHFTVLKSLEILASLKYRKEHITILNIPEQNITQQAKTLLRTRLIVFFFRKILLQNIMQLQHESVLKRLIPTLKYL